MKRCPACNRTYSDDAKMFCADDGSRLVTEQAARAESNVPPSAQPTLVAPPQFTPAPGPSHQPTPKKRKWLAVIALVLGVFALPFLLYSLSQPLLWEFGFRNLRFDRLAVSLWGVATLFGTLLMILSVIVGAIALVLSMRQPARYGGKALAVVGPVLSVLLMVLVVGAFAFRRMQGPKRYDIDIAIANSNYNSNYNSNRSYNSAANTNSNSNNSYSSSDTMNMSETDKYRLFYAAAKSGDPSLQQRAAKKIGIVDSAGMPTSTYQSFVKGTVNWAFTDRAWVQTMDTTEKARAYALERLDPTP